MTGILAARALALPRKDWAGSWCRRVQASLGPEAGTVGDHGPEAEALPIQGWAPGPRRRPGADVLKEVVGGGWRF